MTRNARVLEVILQRTPGKVSTTRLLKFAYMADYLAWRTLGAPITEFRYIRYKQGPFDPDYYRAKEELLERGLAAEEERTTWLGKDCTLISGLSRKEETPGEFSRGQLFIIDHVVKTYGRIDLKDFLRAIVYETPPMKTATPGQLLPMAAEKGKESEELGGISLETVLESREQFARGEFVSLKELRGQLAGHRG